MNEFNQLVKFNQFDEQIARNSEYLHLLNAVLQDYRLKRLLGMDYRLCREYPGHLPQTLSLSGFEMSRLVKYLDYLEENGRYRILEATSDPVRALRLKIDKVNVTAPIGRKKDFIEITKEYFKYANFQIDEDQEPVTGHEKREVECRTRIAIESTNSSSRTKVKNRKGLFCGMYHGGCLEYIPIERQFQLLERLHKEAFNISAIDLKARDFARRILVGELNEWIKPPNKKNGVNERIIGFNHRVYIDRNEALMEETSEYLLLRRLEKESKNPNRRIALCVYDAESKHGVKAVDWEQRLRKEYAKNFVKEFIQIHETGNKISIHQCKELMLTYIFGCICLFSPIENGLMGIEGSFSDFLTPEYGFQTWQMKDKRMLEASRTYDWGYMDEMNG